MLKKILSFKKFFANFLKNYRNYIIADQSSIIIIYIS